MVRIKSGEIISWKEYFKRWGEGIKNLTPKQRISNERISTFISLVGFLLSFIAIIIFREKFVVSWFAYGLILIFLGSIISNFFKLISYNQMLRELKKGEDNSVDVKDMLNNIDKIFDEQPDATISLDSGEVKGMSGMCAGVGLDKNIRDTSRRDKI